MSYEHLISSLLHYFLNKINQSLAKTINKIMMPIMISHNDLEVFIEQSKLNGYATLPRYLQASST